MNLIDIGGKKRPFRFGWNAIDIFCQGKGITIEQYGTQGIAATPGDVRSMVYAGLVGGCLSNKQEVDFTPYDVGDWLDEIGAEGIENIMKLISAGYSKKKVLPSPKNMVKK